jgi:hypothetical protein
MRIFFTLACAGLFACSDPPIEVPFEDAYSVVVGTGDKKYVALEDDSTVPLIHGIQDGYHVWTSLLAKGFQTDVLRMNLVTQFEGEAGSAVTMSGNLAVTPTADPEGAMVLGMFGWPASIDNPRCADGKRLILDLTVTDQDGHQAHDRRSCWVDVGVEYRAADCEP